MRRDPIEPAADLKAVKIYKGLSIYKVRGSQFWYVRVWDSAKQKYVAKGRGKPPGSEPGKTPSTSLPRASAPSRRSSASSRSSTTPREPWKRGSRLVAEGERHVGTVKAIEWALQNADWGLLKWFGGKDVRNLRTVDFSEYMTALTRKHPELSASSKNSIMSAFRNVLKVAREDGAIDDVPDTPRAKQQDNPRPFFRFHPLVAREADSYRRLLKAAREMAEAHVVIRGIPVTYELYDVILFLTHTFVRPLSSELYALKQSDVTVSESPRGLTPNRSCPGLSSAMRDCSAGHGGSRAANPNVERDSYLTK